MKIRKISLICMFLAVSLTSLGGCSFSGTDYGTQKKPAGVNQTVVYDGMEASKEKNRFKAEITLEDVVRGEEAQDVFASAGGYASYHEALELDDDEELLVARFTFSITDAVEDMVVDLGERDVNIFKLISEDGETYDYFLQRRYVDGNLFTNASKGSTQTGCLFYLVDKEDKNPSIVFMPGVNDGLWFRTSLTSSDKKQVEEPILVSDWLDAGGKGTAASAGTINTPLPIGEYGYMYCSSSHFGEYEIELRVDEVLRGSEAEELLPRLDRYENNKLVPQEGQEYLLVKITVNVPSADMKDGSYLDFYVGDCHVINSITGQEYDFENSIDFMDNSVTDILSGGSSEGWFGYIVDKNDPAPVMFYQSLDDKMMYYKLDKAYDLSDDVESYASVLPDQDPIRDDSCGKGDWKNPYGMGETVNVDYKPYSGFSQDVPFAGTIQVMEAYRGETAKEILGNDYYSDFYQKKYMEPVVLKLKVKVDSAKGDNAPSFEGGKFTVLSGRGGIMGIAGISNTVFVKDGLDKVYPGGTAEGYVGILVPEGTGHMEVAYGQIYEGADGAWIDLEFQP